MRALLNPVSIVSIAALIGVTVVSSGGLHAQQTTIVLPPSNGKPASGGFSGFGAAPISATAVLQSYMDATDRGATLGYAVSIRGPAGWYNTRTRFGELAADSLPVGAVGQWWQVGERRYQVVYDRVQQTLTLFDTVVNLRQSRVVLVTLSPEAGGRATVVGGAPVSITMSEPTSFAGVFLPLAPEVRRFAGIEPPTP